jgi:integrase
MAAGVRQRHGNRCSGRGRCDCPWQASVYSKRDGKKLRQNFPTQAAAKAWRADKLSAANRGRLRVPTGSTVRQAAGELLEGMRDGSITTRTRTRYKAATIRGYEEALTLRILPALGHKRLADVDREDVQDLADRLIGDGLSASTVQNTLDPLRVIYRRAVRRRFVTVDPTEGLELLAPDGKRDRIATPAEAASLLAALPDSERALWACAFYSGVRRGELRALRWSDVDMASRVIHVQRGWDAQEGEQDGKSAAADRRVPILDLLAPELAAHKLRTNRGAGALVFGRDAEQPFVPSTVRNQALKAWGWKQVANEDEGARPKMLWVRAREDALQPIGLHEARHTCASILIAAGANAKALSVIMGHSTIAMTFDVYGHLMPGGLQEAAASANAYLARDGERPVLRLAG